MLVRRPTGDQCEECLRVCEAMGGAATSRHGHRDLPLTSERRMKLSSATESSAVLIWGRMCSSRSFRREDI